MKNCRPCHARPAKSILDASFRYVPSHATDVSKTFERVRRESVIPTKRRLFADDSALGRG